MSLTVTVVDEQTGETETQHVDDGDYVLIAAAPCYVANTQAYPMAGTHVLTIKGRRGRGVDLNASPAAKPNGPLRP